MNEMIDFLKANNYGFLATCDGGIPRVRPFGFMFEEDGKLYFCTNNTKDVYTQLIANPSVEYAMTAPDMRTLRIAGKAVFTEEQEKKEKCLEASSTVHAVYKTADNPIFKAFYIEHGKATMVKLGGGTLWTREF
jgi:uncharacterized pyridoxamine 5'-phosphate oxidase family protein